MPQSRQTIEQVIRARLEAGEKALVPYFTAGFPNPLRFVDALRLAADSGCDVVEVGVPFSDPIADGPVIQNAGQYCLEQGITVRRALDLIDRAAIPIPVVLMSYINPLLAYGCQRLTRDARAVGVRGCVVPDLPMAGPQRQGRDTSVSSALHPLELTELLRTDGLELILLAAPTTGATRLRKIGEHTRGFLYAVTITGVTGVRGRMPPETTSFLRRAHTATVRPVLAGFGIASAKTASQLAAHCDGVIIGSAIIEILRNGAERTAVSRLRRFLTQMRTVLSQGKGD